MTVIGVEVIPLYVDRVAVNLENNIVQLKRRLGSRAGGGLDEQHAAGLAAELKIFCRGGI